MPQPGIIHCIMAFADLELQEAPETIILDVQNMKCGGCTASVKRILEGIPEVSTASVNLLTESAAVTVRGPGNDHAPGTPSDSTAQDAATLLSKRVSLTFLQSHLQKQMFATSVSQQHLQSLYAQTSLFCGPQNTVKDLGNICEPGVPQAVLLKRQQPCAAEASYMLPAENPAEAIPLGAFLSGTS